MARDSDLVIENVRIVSRNFVVVQGEYNAKDERNFRAILPQLLVPQMIRDGWNVKTLRTEGGPEEPYVTVAVSFKRATPELILVSSKGRVDLSEDEIGILDRINIKRADLVIRPYLWSFGDKTGIKAFLQSIVVIEQE